jgi:hypothetical protein
MNIARWGRGSKTNSKLRRSLLFTIPGRPRRTACWMVLELCHETKLNFLISKTLVFRKSCDSFKRQSEPHSNITKLTSCRKVKCKIVKYPNSCCNWQYSDNWSLAFSKHIIMIWTSPRTRPFLKTLNIYSRICT